MTPREKYQPVLDLGQEVGLQNIQIKEREDHIEIGGAVDNQFQKDQLWDEIKRIGGENPNDLVADIKVNNAGTYATYTVKSGDTLGAISKKYYGKSGQYMDIFNANKDKLDNPDKIFPGQELVIPAPKG